MWQCRHCKKEFDYLRATEKANHSRHCSSNPNKHKSYENIKSSVNKIIDSKLGKKKNFSVICDCCGETFAVKERENQFPSKEKYFCSRSCANSTGGKRKAELYHYDDVASYRTVALRYHELKCIVCGFDSVVDVHHIDENHANNDPKNLVCLCPNHHRMVHTNKFKKDLDLYIKDYIIRQWGQ